MSPSRPEVPSWFSDFCWVAKPFLESFLGGSLYKTDQSGYSGLFSFSFSFLKEGFPTGAGLFCQWQGRSQDSEQGAAEVSVHRVSGLMVLRCQLRAGTPRSWLAGAALSAGRVPPVGRRAPPSVFVQKCLSTVVSWPYRNCGINRTESYHESNRIEAKSETMQALTCGMLFPLLNKIP